MNAVPTGYHTITPFLPANDANELIRFLEGALAAEVKVRTDLEGTVLNAELRIGDSMVMVADTRGRGLPYKAMLYLYVPDADAAYERAVAAGAKAVMPPTDQFYGDRSGAVEDPEGNQWWLASRIEDVSSDEVKRRAAAGRKQS